MKGLDHFRLEEVSEEASSMFFAFRAHDIWIDRSRGNGLCETACRKNEQLLLGQLKCPFRDLDHDFECDSRPRRAMEVTVSCLVGWLCRSERRLLRRKQRKESSQRYEYECGWTQGLERRSVAGSPPVHVGTST